MSPTEANTAATSLQALYPEMIFEVCVRQTERCAFFVSAYRVDESLVLGRKLVQCLFSLDQCDRFATVN